MKKLFILLITFFVISNTYSQSSIENYLEGKKYQNSSTGLIINYGYISSMNTYGITFTNGYGNKFYFMNCNSEVSDDESCVVFTNCLNPENGNGVGTIYAYRSKIIVDADDGRLVYYPLESNNQSENNYLPATKSVKPNLSKRQIRTSIPKNKNLKRPIRKKK